MGESFEYRGDTRAYRQGRSQGTSNGEVTDLALYRAAKRERPKEIRSSFMFPVLFWTGAGLGFISLGITLILLAILNLLFGHLV